MTGSLIETIDSSGKGKRLTKEEKEARECPFSMVAVPNIAATGETDRRYPIVGERAVCGKQCALYDVENNRNCEERRLADEERRALRLIEAIKLFARPIGG